MGLTGTHKTQRGSLKWRRRMALARRLVAACCAGLAVYAGLDCVISATDTVAVVVADSAIKRGERITADMVSLRTVATSSVLRSALRDTTAAVGRVAQVDIEAGQPLFAAFADAMPVVPEGYTVVEVRLSSDATRVVMGDVVSLASAAGCSANARIGGDAGIGLTESDMNAGAGNNTEDSPNTGNASDANAQPMPGEDAGTTDSADSIPTDESAETSDVPANDGTIAACVLAERAIVMDQPAKSNGGLLDTDSPDARVVPLAMPPDAALRVMKSQEAGAIVAVRSVDDVTKTRSSRD